MSVRTTRPAGSIRRRRTTPARGSVNGMTLAVRNGLGAFCARLRPGTRTCPGSTPTFGMNDGSETAARPLRRTWSNCVNPPPTYAEPPESESALTAPGAYGAQSSSDPVPVSNAARLSRVIGPARLWKLPPTNNVLCDTRSALTGPFGAGFHGVGTPVERSTSASFVRDWPPMLVKFPATNIVPLPSASALTFVFDGALGFGFHAVASPVVVSIAASAFRDAPPMLVKNPPAYTTP